MFSKQTCLFVTLTIFYIIQNPICVSTQTCKAFDDCSEKEMIYQYKMAQCGICDNGGSGVGTCKWPLRDRFTVLEGDEQKRCISIRTCLNNCSLIGKCISPINFSPACSCPDGYYGADCSKRTPASKYCNHLYCYLLV